MIRTKKEAEEEEIQQEEFDNKLDLLKYTTEVHGRIKRDVTSDFVLAKSTGTGIDEKKRDAMIELICDAYFCKILFEIIKRKARKPAWDEEKGYWKWQKVETEEQAKITRYQNETFDMYLIRPQMITVMSRNIDKNKMMEWLTAVEETEETEEPITKESITKKIKRKLAKNEEKKEE